jgi:glucose/mannose-6-phosphate isomerase
MNMEKLIQAFPENITEALEIASKVQLRKPESAIANVVICGMGGSGIGGRLLSKWVEGSMAIPVYVVQDYYLPDFVDEKTMVIGSSYSGDTEETLMCVEDAIQRKAHLVGVTSGGKLAELGEEHQFDVIKVPGGNPPRTALAYSLIQLTNIFVQNGFVDTGILQQIEKARLLLIQEEKSIKKKAKELAAFLSGEKTAVLYGSTAFEPVLVRGRQQINENSKLLCWHHVIPEMNHNELVGWGGGDNRFAVVFFDSLWLNARNKKRVEITEEVIKGKTFHVKTIRGVGKSLIEQSIYFINVIDWTSYYLANLRQVDAVEVDVIDYLKSELSKLK